MPLQLHDHVAVLTGVLTVEETEPLVAWLRNADDATVDLDACFHLHTAALQALLLFRPTVAAAPRNAFLAEHIMPCLMSAGGR